MRKKFSSPLFSLSLISLLILAVVTLWQQQEIVHPEIYMPADIASAADSAAFNSGNDLNCRYGMAALNETAATGAANLKMGWYLNFSRTPSPVEPQGIEYVQVIEIKQDKDLNGNYLPTYSSVPPLSAIDSYVTQNPGSLWVIGNEVDRGPNPGADPFDRKQGDTFPDVYADAYFDFYHAIKALDPTAQVTPSAMVQVTPGRLQYLDILLAEYADKYNTQLPVDVWNMHLYILSEVNSIGQPNSIANVALGTDINLARRASDGTPNLCPLTEVYCFAEHDDISVFAEQVVAMRTWMAANGYRNKPLIFSEYSILFPYEIDDGGCFISDEFGQCFTPQRVSNFATATINYFETATDPNIGFPGDNNKLVQQWLWYASYVEGEGVTSNIFLENNTTLTQVGTTIRNQIASRPRIANLFVDLLLPSTPDIPNGSTTANATLTARIRNNGNTNTNQFTVTFYRNAAMTQVIDSVVVTDAGGCGRQTVDASVQWNGLTAGVHRYWVKVDSGSVITETSENDNSANGRVIVDGGGVLMPLIRR